MKELSKVLSWKNLLSYNPLSSDKINEYEEAYRNNGSFNGWFDGKKFQMDVIPTDIKYGIPVNIIGDPCLSNVFLLFNKSIN